MKYHYRKVCFFFIFVLFFTGITEVLGETPCGVVPTSCPPKTIKYRTLDGSCNNFKYPWWGSTGSMYGRLLPPRYGTDGVSPVQSCCTGKPLPNVRQLGLQLFLTDNILADQNRSRSNVGVLKFVAADLSNLKQPAPMDACCTCDMQFLKNTPAYCKSIGIPDNDPVYSQFNAKCISVVDGITNVDLNCSTSCPRTPISSTTAWLDASIIYGSSEDECNSIRLFYDGQIYLEKTKDGNYYFPNNTADQSQCRRSFHYGDEVCFKINDNPFINMFADLTILVTMAAREHNKIALTLKEINPCWNDERLFQESRRIVIGQYQHVVMNEVFPKVLGRENMINAGLLEPGVTGYHGEYDNSCDPSTVIEFSHLAMKSLHGMAVGSLGFSDANLNPLGTILLRDVFQRPGFLLNENNFDNSVHSFCAMPVFPFGARRPKEVSTHLDLSCLPVGPDLTSIELQRCRLIGMPSYNDLREYCGYKRATCFDDLLDLIDKENVNNLARLYSCVEDVESFAAILENPCPFGVFGPILHKICLDQIRKMKNGDRFWFEFPSSGFSEDQVDELRKHTTAKYYCNNGNAITKMLPDVYSLSGDKNGLVDCQLIPKKDFEKWRDPSCSCSATTTT